MKTLLKTPSGWRPDSVRVATEVLAILIVALFLTATTTIVTRPPDTGATAVEAVAPVPGPGQAPGLKATGPRRFGDPLTAKPLRVRIPTIGTDAVLDPLGLNDDGTLEVPPYERAGWFEGAAKPGENGPAVIAAHVDSRTGPAVFFKLNLVRAGDTVTVDYDDGTRVDFVVQGAETFPKSAFPTERVYGPTSGPELRLITCGGSFDRRAGSYRDNLIVWATATSRQLA